MIAKGLRSYDRATRDSHRHTATWLPREAKPTHAHAAYPQLRHRARAGGRDAQGVAHPLRTANTAQDALYTLRVHSHRVTVLISFVKLP